MKPTIILLFDIDKLLHWNQGSYIGKLFQYVKELFWKEQELDYNIIINAYNVSLSTTAILIANPKDRHSVSPELSVIASHQAAGKIIIAFSFTSETKQYNDKIERQLRSKLYRAGAPENYIVSFYNQTRKQILGNCLEMFGLSVTKTSLIEFQNGQRMQIPKEVLLTDEEIEFHDQNEVSD